MIKGEEIALKAREWIGTPYRHQASKKNIGCDCLGLLRGVWREIVGGEPMKIPPYSANWRDRENIGALEKAADRFLVKTNEKPKIGDVVLFKMIRGLPPKHCAIMVDEHAFVHAQEHIGVVEADLSDAWVRKISGVYHF